MDEDVESSGTAQRNGQSEPTNYAFLNHSTVTLPNNLPPNVDNKPLARQKRKRTSPEDQVLLEEAYQRDPKPDKAARLELVKRIALGEKEVQIWFQNRRQTSRRKSRPLLPHEIAQYQLSRSSSFPTGNIDHHDRRMQDFPGNEPSSQSEIHGRSDASEGDAEDVSVSSSDSAHCLSVPKTTAQEDASGEQSAPNHKQTHDARPSSTDNRAVIAAPIERSFAEHGTGLGYLANRRSLPSLRHLLDGTSEPPSQPTTSYHGSERRLKKSTSYVRLSMTSEGNAKVITKDNASPSPPRPQQYSMQPQSSQGGSSDVSPLVIEPKPSISVNLTRSTSGRSRDSRAWEFWCDKDSRCELEEKAQKDGNGSAADAIGLIRATSTRKVLSSVPSKRNSNDPRHDSQRFKRAFGTAKRLPLQRASTSNGRLQNGGSRRHAGNESHKKSAGLKTSKSGVSAHVPGHDSDKENWSPEGSRLVRNESFERRHGAGNTIPEADAEIAAFMGEGRKGRALSGDEELDCVQGLLSLSQGTWAA